MREYSLKRKLVFTSMWLIIIGLIFSALMSYTVYCATNESRVEADKYLASALGQLTEETGQAYYSMYGLTRQMISSGSLGRLLDQQYYTKNNYKLFLQKREFAEAFADLKFSNTQLEGMGYYDGETNQCIYGDIIQTDINIDTDIPKIVQNKNLIFHGLHKSIFENGRDEVVSCCYLTEIGGRAVQIYLEMKMNTDEYINQKVTLTKYQDIGATFIQVNRDNVICFSNNRDLPVNTRFSIREFKRLEGSKAEYRDYIAIFNQSKFGFYNIMLIAKDQYRAKMLSWIPYIALAFCVFIILISFLIVQSYKMITKPLGGITKEIKEVGLGCLETRILETDIVEFKQISQDINHMKLQIGSLIADLQRKEREKSEWEIQKLRYQINPHFLLNTINSAIWLVRMNRFGELKDFLSSLTNILAYNLRDEKKTVTFRSELEMLDRYLLIQKMRYDFTIKLQVEEGDYLDKRVFKLLFQPLVENSIQHGLGEDGGIIVKVFHNLKMDMCVVTIEDNGGGLTAEQLRQLNQPLLGMEKEPGNKGIGIRYIKNMLYHYYGDSAIFSINSNHEKGTKVTVMIPVMEELYD